VIRAVLDTSVLDDLDGEDVLPGFRYPVAGVFGQGGS
jgi:hypothetical protein